MIRFLQDLIRDHGWHAVAELAFLAFVTVFSAIYLTALVRGRVRAVTCPSCGRVASRAHRECPRCHATLEPG